jgi:hypothetical protein
MNFCKLLQTQANETMFNRQKGDLTNRNSKLVTPISKSISDSGYNEQFYVLYNTLQNKNVHSVQLQNERRTTFLLDWKTLPCAIMNCCNKQKTQQQRAFYLTNKTLIRINVMEELRRPDASVRGSVSTYLLSIFPDHGSRKFIRNFVICSRIDEAVRMRTH